MDILIKALQVLLSLSLLVATHELGHFFFAKLFKTRVEKFYLFFDPWFSLFKFRKGETEYGIGWVPFGGYVKISGMVDESMDTEQLQKPAEPWEFRSKPAWQRLLIMLGGVMVNFVSALLIFWMIYFVWGESYLPTTEARFGMQFDPLMHEIGFQDGDKITKVNGYAVDKYRDIVNPILLDENTVVSVVRDGDSLDIAIPAEFFRKVLDGNKTALFAFRFPVVVDEVVPDGNADAAGMQPGDSIISVGGTPTPMFNDFSQRRMELKGQMTDVVVMRNSIADTLSVQLDSLGRMGVITHGPLRWMQMKTAEYSFFEAFPAGIAHGFDVLSNYVKQLPILFTKEGANQIGGFGSIGKLFPDTWDWMSFWHNTAFLAIMLAVMNILPIPALDGGHVLFLLYEIITRRKPSDKFLEYAQTVGMILLFALILFANGNDIIRAIF